MFLPGSNAPAFWPLNASAWIRTGMALLGLASWAQRVFAEDPGHPRATLTTVLEVNLLSDREAFAGRRLHLEGVVTYWNPNSGLLFIQDKTGGLVVRSHSKRDLIFIDLSPGDRVAVDALTSGGSYAPQAGDTGTRSVPSETSPFRTSPAVVTKLGKGLLPLARKRSRTELMAPYVRALFVKVEGIVRSVKWDPASEEIRLRISGENRTTFEATVFGATRQQIAAASKWVNVPVEFSGTVGVLATKRERWGSVLRVPSFDEMHPDFALLEAWFAQPEVPLNSISRFNSIDTSSERSHLRGVVTLARPGLGFWLQGVGGTPGALWIESTQEDRLEPGDLVDVVGLVSISRGVRVEDAVYRIVRRKTPLQVKVVEASKLPKAARFASELISVEGTLLSTGRTRGRDLLFLEDRGTRFEAGLETGKTSSPFSRLEPGALVKITGICNPEKTSSQDPNPADSALSIELRSDADVEVLQQPSWLTSSRLRWIAGALISVIALILSWVWSLRREVLRQTESLAAKRQQASIWEERNRMARELHDTLEQQLAGIRIQLLCAVDEIADDPEDARECLTSAMQMLEYSHAETRRAVWDLRSHVLEQGGVAKALESIFTSHNKAESPKIEILESGEVRRLPGLVEFHLLRIAQECVTNAIKHANARWIKISIGFGADKIQLIVEDDGCGLIEQARQESGTGGFGWIGVQERVGKINGTVARTGRGGQGTRITVDAPVASDSNTSPNL